MLFIIQGQIESLSSADKEIVLPIPVDCEIEEAYAVCDGAVASGSSNKLVLQVISGSDLIFEKDSEADGFADDDALQLVSQEGSKRFEQLSEVKLKCTVGGTISVAEVRFVLKCKRARDY
tara:strand:+ start:7447 stop:7806 length:360 start_codon:yes stop_codon:yes gene_type:complete